MIKTFSNAITKQSTNFIITPYQKKYNLDTWTNLQCNKDTSLL